MSYTPFSLQTLIKALPFEDSQQATQSSGGGNRLFGGREGNRAGAGSRLTSSIGWGNKDSQVTVESVEAWENNLYIGTSDGQLIHYLLDDQVLSKDNIPSNFLISKQALSWKRKVERIMLLPQINTAVILCESTLSFYSLPEMTALPTTNFPWIKGVTCFCHDTSKEGKLERDGSVKLCVMKKRTLHIYSLTDRYSEETPMQVPDGAITACQYGPYIFVADLHQYKIINLSTKRMEIVQPYLSDIGDSFNPIVTVIRAGEFLLTIPTTNQMTFGQFVSSTGEAIRGIIQWEGLPRAISVEFPYVVALLRNNTIEIHDITELKLVQREVLSSKSKTISTGPGIKVQVAGLIDKLKLESGYLLNEDNSSSQLDNNTSSDVDGLQILTGSSSNQSNFLATIPTRLIIAGSESVVALAATPLIVQADSMLDSSARIDEAVELARQAMKTSTPDNVHSEIMRHESNYILQKSGFLYLGETLFEMAFPLFEEGGIDPRLLIQLFGNLREIICYDNNFTVYSGVKTIIKRLGAIDDIVSRSLVKNYDPHIKPDLESSHATKELRKVLIKNAKEMLQKFLTKYREQRRDKGKTLKPDKRNILRAVDNALLRLYAESNSEQLNSLLENSNECVLELSEKILFDNKKYYPLALLYKDNKEYKKALELWKKIFEEDHPDKDGPNCLKQMANLLRKLDDHDMVLEYANWITKHDEVIGAQIFIQPNLRRSLLIEPSLVLDQLRTVGKNGLKLYLEYLVIQRKSQEEQHHTELALLYVEELETILQSNEAKVKIETMTNEFIKNPNDSAKTYLSFLLNQSKEDLLSQGRATLITFLQSSTRYNAKLILNKLLEIQILKAELAVVYGKLDDHEKALHILVDDLRDYRGAEFYCLYAGRMIGIISAKKQSDNKSIEDKDLISTRRTLFLMLLKVYLQNGNEIIEKIINLLNTHAVYLDTNEVMELLPEFWSVEMLNEFLIRSLRQNYHEYREGQILKGLCRGENTMTSFELYQAYQAIGPIVINQNVSCSICKEYISGSDFMRQPNNDIVHVNCNNSEHRENNTAVSDPLSNQT